MRRATIALAGLLTAIVVSACAGQGQSVTPSGDTSNVHDDIYGSVQRITVDGVDCILYQDRNSDGGGALSCDWPAPSESPSP